MLLIRLLGVKLSAAWRAGPHMHGLGVLAESMIVDEVSVALVTVRHFGVEMEVGKNNPCVRTESYICTSVVVRV